MKHKWLRNFDKDGNWTKPERVIRVDGVLHDLDEYAKTNGVELPDSKHKTKKKDIKVKYEDLGETLEEGDSKES